MKTVLLSFPWQLLLEVRSRQSEALSRQSIELSLRSRMICLLLGESGAKLAGHVIRSFFKPVTHPPSCCGLPINAPLSLEV